MKYKIRLEKGEEGYSVSCPGLPGPARMLVSGRD